MLFRSIDVERAIRQPLFLPESSSILDALKAMKQSPVHIAFVVDEFGSFEGLLTLTDIIESIAGDLAEEGGRRPTIVHQPQAPRRAWLEQCERAPGFFQIGIAHGSFEGLSPDLEKDYFPMNAAELEKFRMDLWLMGHIHVQFPPKPSPQSRIFYSGTHEPDGMDCKHEGKAWLIELQEDRSVKASSISTGSFRFHEEEVEIRSRSELESLGTRLSLAKNMIVRLKVRGALPRADFEGVAGVIEEIRSRVFFLHSDLSQLSIALTPEEIGNEFPEGGFAYRLLTELSTREKDRAALQLAYEMIQGGER